MGPRPRVAVATYVEVFILIGLAVGGSGIVFGAALKATVSTQGPSVAVTGATIRQGTYVALESLTVYNTGNAPFSSFTVTTSGVPVTASYCYTVYDPVGRLTISTTCPGISTNPASIVVAVTLSPGQGVLLELTLMGASFSVGSVSRLVVTGASGAQQSLNVEVVPA